MIIEGVKDFVIYVPKWNGNRDLPEKEQVRVTIRVPNLQEKYSFSTTYSSGDGVKIIVDFDAVMTHVEKIENLEYSKEKILTGTDILKHGGLLALADDIGGYIIRMGES